MSEILEHSLLETLEISILVFIALVVMDLIYIYSRGKFSSFLKRRPGAQYFISAFLGAIPGCEGAFFAISLHTHGLISFGALLSAFIATTGDEAYVMFSLFPLQAFGITLIFLGLGYIIGWLADIIRKKNERLHDTHCETEIFHPQEEFSLKHYCKEHLWSHLIKTHMVKIVTWTFAAIFIIELAMRNFDLVNFISKNPYWFLLTAAVWGLIPQSGPHLIFVTMYAENSIPFSIFFTNMFVQSGHALLPLLSVSLKDSIIIKAIGLILGIILGSILFLLGI